MNSRWTPRGTGTTRRQTLTALAALSAAGTAGAAGIAGIAGCSAGRPGTAASVPTGPAQASAPGAAEPFTSAVGDKDALLLQVMAHPDDDLYFMNPDAEQVLRSGVPVVCVYVTAGEARGINHQAGTPIPPADKAAYSASRHQGLRQAYAQMLGLNQFAPWERSVLRLPGGVTAETNTLANGGRGVRLIFLNIAMLSDGGVRLPALWNAPGAVTHTLPAAGSPVTHPSSYGHQTLVDVLAEITDRYRPTLIHTLDPDPDFQVHDALHPRDNDQPGCSDHRDHTPVALFTWKAIAQWVAASTQRDQHAPRFTTTAFRGYYNQRWPHNLPPALLAQKARAIKSYGGAPDWDCGNAAGCGDYSQGGVRPLRNRKGWIRSTHYRYPTALPTPTVDAQGRLVAYGVLGTQAVRWRETAPGSGRFGAPLGLGGGPLAPALAAVRDSAGRQTLFALRFAALGGRGAAGLREIVALEQRRPDGPFRPWTGLGTPETDTEHGRRVGCPAAVATPDGRVHLFVRTADKGLATRVRDASGRWGPWQRLGGGEIQDGLTALLDAEGRVHVLAPGRDTVHHWAQEWDGGPVTPRPPSGLPRPGGDQLGAAVAPDGTLTLVYRAPAATVPAVHGETSLTVRHFEGYGAIAAHTVTEPSGRRETRTLLLVGRDLSGEVQVQYGTGPNARPLRSPGHLIPVGAPALLAEGGRQGVRVVGMAPDAIPWIWHPRPTSRA
ncbi:PIG-L family deacetylase [Streptomyces malaysiensis]|uniref:PIG-L family deacetylase n=1 Tax=Streptomyces autolyticus TaxID=75293 RepID=A0ABN4W817_9ACTN|nr:PIG-L family deacetylase [Streptomyces autolyticus]AQA13377.1 PIG-L family deacetylase [Streptomyces autolyticus]